jgi:hypothetical protein
MRGLTGATRGCSFSGRDMPPPHKPVMVLTQGGRLAFAH